MITDAQYAAWLSDPKAIRVVLCEPVVRIGGVETTLYLSSDAYVTGAADTPASQFYQPIISGLSASETLSLTGDATMTIGDVEIRNLNGSLDVWFTYVWANRTLPAWIGDPRWPRADFRMIFNGITADIDSKSRDVINLKLRDKMQRLNNAVSETKLSTIVTDGPTLAALSNKDAIVPVALGEVFNVTPLLVNAATLEYQYSLYATEDVIEVRDNGIPVANTSIGWTVTTKTPATARFKLGAAPAGAVTCSVQGDKPSAYTNTVAGSVQRLVTGFGKSTDRFVAGDLDATSLAAFDTAHPQPVGLYLSDRINVITACQQLAASIGACVTTTRLGLLKLIQIDLASPVSTFDIRPYHMADHDISISQRTEVVAAVKLGFCKDWTLQPGLTTSLSATDKELFDTEWLTTTQVDATTQSVYKLSADPIQEDTLLLRRTDADAEATRRLNMKKVPRAVYQFNSALGSAELLQLVLGQIVTIYHPRFNLAAGGVGMVVSLTPNWITGQVKVGVLI